jgi:uncharacterized membrane-anchored protein YjiN (DUF445 family)
MESSPPAHPSRNMRILALALLVAATLVMVGARLLEARDPGWGYLRAFGEAALIGGLADWFAVVAMFRRPLGLPIPHTAIVPANKDRIGEALGRFVERNFLSPEAVARKLGEVDFAGMLGEWLADPARVRPVAGAAARFVPRALDAFGEEPIREFLRANVAAGLQQIELGPLAAEILEVLTAHNQHQALIDELIRTAERLLREAEPELRVRVAEKTAWLWKKLGVDAAISDRMIEAGEQALAEISADPEHAWRKRFTELTGEYVQALRHSPELRERADALKQLLIGHPVLGEYVGRVWEELRAHVRADAQAPDSRIREALEASLHHLGNSLLGDNAVRAALNGWLRDRLTELARSRSTEVANLIAETVRGWDAHTMADRIERAVGRDLQYIRVNGTLIGGLIGLALYALSHTLLAS